MKSVWIRIGAGLQTWEETAGTRSYYLDCYGAVPLQISAYPARGEPLVYLPQNWQILL